VAIALGIPLPGTGAVERHGPARSDTATPTSRPSSGRPPWPRHAPTPSSAPATGDWSNASESQGARRHRALHPGHRLAPARRPDPALHRSGPGVLRPAPARRTPNPQRRPPARSTRLQSHAGTRSRRISSSRTSGNFSDQTIPDRAPSERSLVTRKMPIVSVAHRRHRRAHQRCLLQGLPGGPHGQRRTAARRECGLAGEPHRTRGAHERYRIVPEGGALVTVQLPDRRDRGRGRRGWHGGTHLYGPTLRFADGFDRGRPERRAVRRLVSAGFDHRVVAGSIALLTRDVFASWFLLARASRGSPRRPTPVHAQR
jgi:hypothetical protein